MFKVPNDRVNPSYDDARKVGFWEWLTSSAETRKEWRRRKDAAILTSGSVRFLEKHTGQDPREGRVARHIESQSNKPGIYLPGDKE